MLPGKAVYEEVVRHFGRDILNRDLTINRGTLAEAAFGRTSEFEVATTGLPSAGPSSAALPSRVEELNRIVHPAVIRWQEEWMESVGRRDPAGVAIVEAALILESGAAKSFDKLIVVTCTNEQRVARFAARQKISIEAASKEVARRMAAQLPELTKVKAANYVIDNSGTLNRTEEQVRDIWRLLDQPPSR
jgi:dephospho-CoA kinase